MKQHSNKGSFETYYSAPVFTDGCPGGSTVKNPPAMQETQVAALGWEDPWRKEMATHSSILDLRTWAEGPDGLQSMASPKVRHDSVTKQKQRCSQK